MLLARDKKEFCGVILNDMSNVFDCVSCNLIVANCMPMDLIEMRMFSMITSWEDHKKLKWALLSVICGYDYGVPQGFIFRTYSFQYKFV